MTTFTALNVFLRILAGPDSIVVRAAFLLREGGIYFLPKSASVNGESYQEELSSGGEWSPLSSL
jgi:hypothetical protein